MELVQHFCTILAMQLFANTSVFSWKLQQSSDKLLKWDGSFRFLLFGLAFIIMEKVDCLLETLLMGHL